MTFDELCSLAGNGKPLPRSALPLERVAYAGLPGCIMLTGTVLFPRTKPLRKRSLRREYEDARKKEKDGLKLHQYVDQIRTALAGWFKKVEQSGCLYAGSSLRFWTGGI